ncbi:MAG TPA: hypothetical protein VGF16_03465 [Bryobacteraceae bacterium]
MLQKLNLVVLAVASLAGVCAAESTTPVPPHAVAPFLFATPQALFFHQTGTTPPESQTVAVSVRSGTLGALSVTPSGGAWLSASATGNKVTVSVNTTGLGSGLYNGSLSLSATGFTSASVKVFLAIVGSEVVAYPDTIHLHTVAGGQGNAMPREVEVFSRNGSSFNWTAASDQSWLLITPTSGTGKSTIQVSIDPTKITAAGSLKGHITVTDTTNSTTATVTVSLDVDGPKPPDFEMGPFLHQPGVLHFVAESNASTPAPEIFYGRNVGGGGSLSFTLTGKVNSPSGGNWLSFTPATNTTPGKTTVTVNPTGLAPGDYSATITGTAQEPAGVTGGDLTSSVNVYLKVLGNPSVRVDHRFLRFTASTKQAPPVPSPASETLKFVTKSASGYPFTAKTTTSKGGNWLLVSPASGTATNGGTITVSVDAAAIASLAPGYYTGQVQLSYSGGAPDAEETVGVSLRIFGTTDLPRLSVHPGGMVFIAKAGGSNPAPKSVDVRAISAAAAGLNYTVASAVTTPSGGTWLSAGSTGGTATSTATAVPINVNITGLAAGLYSGTVTFTPDPSSNAPSQIVNVKLLVISAAKTTGPAAGVSPLGSTLRGSFNGMLAAGSLVSVTTYPADGFSTSTDGALNLSVMVLDADGTPVPGATVVLASSNGEPNVTLEDLGDGAYSGLFEPESSGPVTLSLAAQVTDNSGNLFETATSVSGDVVAAADASTPVYTSGAISAASYAPQPTPLTPGSLISLFGYNLAGAGGAATTLPLPTSLNGVSVTIGGIPAPLIASAPASAPGGTDQINLQVPVELAGRSTADIVVTNNGVSGAPETVALGTAPAFFTLNAAGTGDGIFVHSDGITVITPGSPARGGETVVLYATGLGDVQAPVASGLAFTGPNRVTGSVTVTIGGQPASVLYAGGLPGFAGVYQLNVMVPANLPPGENAVTVVVDGTPSTGEATVAVQ